MLSMSNLARIAKVVALLLFLLPWVTISCSPQALGPMSGGPPAGMSGTGDMTIAKATGVQLAMGTVATTNPNPTAASAPPNPFSTPNLPILGGGLLILLALAVTFVLKGGKGALVAAGACAAAAAALCYAVMVQIPEAVRGSFASSTGSGPETPPINPAELAQMIQVKVEIGFWLTIAALVAAIVLNVLGMRASAAPAAAAAPPEAPPAG
jgi:hypothetical protein